MSPEFLPVAVVLGLLGATLWWLRRKGMAAFSLPVRAGRTRTMELIERIPLGSQHALHLVRVADRQLLVASSPSGCQVLEMGDGARAQ